MNREKSGFGGSARGTVVGALLCGALLRGAETQPGDSALPAGGRSILIDPLAEFAESRENKNGRARVVEARGPGFVRALEVESKVRRHDWDYQVWWKLAAPVKKDDSLLVCFWARTVFTADESGQSLINVRIEVPGLWKLPAREKTALAPLTKGLLLAVGPEWRQFFIRARAPRDMAAKDVFVALRCGMERQRVQFGGIDVLDYGNSVDSASLPVTHYTYAGREPNAPWRKEAEARIRQQRMREVRFVVRDARGRPVEGARVEIDLQRHRFQFGSAFTSWKVLEEFNPDYRQYRRRILENFNSGSFVNALKWHAWDGDWGAHFDRSVTLRALKWVADRKLPFRGHCLVWPRKKSVSNALRKMLEAQPPDPQAIRQRIVEHLRDICPATKFWMEEWDVLNESIPCHDVQDICGDGVMVEWFKETRRLLPNVKLALNEYSILASRSDTEKVLKHEARIKYLLDHGAPLDVLGMQGHMGGFPPGPRRLLEVLERFSKFNLPIRVTEFDMKSDDPSLLYDFTRDFYTVMFSHPLVIGVQMWGFDQMYDKHGNLTPIGRAFRDVVRKKWHTREGGTTGADGTLSCRGYLGSYTATVAVNGRKTSRMFVLPRGKGVHEVVFDLQEGAD